MCFTNSTRPPTFMETDTVASGFHGKLLPSTIHIQRHYQGRKHQSSSKLLQPEDYTETINFLKSKFKDRHYPKQLLNQPAIPFEQWKDILMSTSKEKSKNKFITFVCPYEANRQIKKCIG